MPAPPCRCLSVVIPAYREERRLGPTLDRIVAHLGTHGSPWEILVVDDGSPDGTARIVEARADPRIRVLRLERNRGKGAATRHGVAASRGCLVLITDADLSTPIGEYDRLEREIRGGGADIAIGSRALETSRIVRAQPGYRSGLGKIFNRILRAGGLSDLKDTQCGFKLLRGSLARSLFARLLTERFAFDVELLWLARRWGAKIAEVGVEWAHAESSRVRIAIDAPRMLLDVLWFRVRHWLQGSEPPAEPDEAVRAPLHDR